MESPPDSWGGPRGGPRVAPGHAAPPEELVRARRALSSVNKLENENLALDADPNKQALDAKQTFIFNLNFFCGLFIRVRVYSKLSTDLIFLIWFIHSGCDSLCDV